MFQTFVYQDKIKFIFGDYKYEFSYNRNLDDLLIGTLDKFFKRNSINLNSLNSFKIKKFLDKDHSSVRIVKVVMDALAVVKPDK